MVASAAEAELAALFYNCKEACAFRNTLEELGRPQPATPTCTDNTTASGIANDTVKQKRSKAIDMRFYWVRDRVSQNQFQIYWQKGKLNRADYFTKHHPASHHKEIRSACLYEPNDETNYFDLMNQEKLVSWDPAVKPPAQEASHITNHATALTPGEGVLK